MTVVLALLLSTGATAQAGTPLTCQPNAEQPMLPVFHIIGNVTKVSPRCLAAFNSPFI